MNQIITSEARFRQRVIKKSYKVNPKRKRIINTIKKKIKNQKKK